jgi:exonuclease III
MVLKTPPHKKSLVMKPYIKECWMELRKQPGQVRRKRDMLIGTWNVWRLYQPRASKKLEEELKRYKVDIAAIQEIRWKQIELTELRHYILINSGSKENNYGTGFMVSKEIKQNLISYKTVNERICTVRMRGRFFNTTFISIHAPTEEKEEDIKDQFYERLERTHNEIPRNDIKIILGDFNAKIGKDVMYRPAIGTHSRHETNNENGQRIVDFTSGKNICISSMYFPHKNIHKETWISPDGGTQNQIDHVITDTRHAKDIIDVKTCRGADCDSDHFLV